MDRGRLIYEIACEIQKKTGKNDWAKAKAIYESKSDDKLPSVNAARKAYDYYVRKNKQAKIRPVATSSTIREVLIEELKNERTIEELCQITGKTQVEILGTIELLRIEGYEIIQFRMDGKIGYTINKNVQTTYHEFKHYHEACETFRIGLVSDTHICSKFWQETYLKLAYTKMKEMGVKDVYHAGDVTDGFYKDRMEETYAFGADAQTDEVVEKYPEEDEMTTHFITGNHDFTHMRNGGADIGKAIANRRKDMDYLGRDYAKVWLTKDVDMDLIHPGDGTAYALSYQLQKRINNMSGGKKPKILITGHYHKYFKMFYRNVIAMSLPSFQAQSNWMRGKAIESDIGFVVVDITVNEDGQIIQFVDHFFPFYIPLKEDYQK